MFNCLIFTIMKRCLFMLGAAVAVLSSCTQNEIINVNESRAIGFDSFVGKPTRAAVNSVDELSAFQVFGGYGTTGALAYDNVYDDVTVTRDGVSGSYTWKPDETKYWQKGYTYTFNAYAPKLTSGNGTASVDVNGVTVTNFVADGATDLLIATTKNEDTSSSIPNTAVQFTFNHVLSMIRFTFATTLEDVTISITDLKVNDVPCKATYTNSVWQTPVADTKSTYGLTVANDITKDASQNSSEAIVIPQTFGAGLNVTFKLTATGALSITGEDGSGVQHSVTLPTTAWGNGKRYNYTATFDITNIDPDNPDNYKPIEFGTPTVTPWDTEGNDWNEGNVVFPES